MAVDCARFVQACAVRFIELTAAGQIVDNASAWTSNDLISLQVEPEVEEGVEFNEKNACNVGCLVAKLPDRVKWVNLTLSLCYITPPMLEIVLGGGTLLGTDQGYQYIKPTAADPLPSSLEVWEKAVDSNNAAATSAPYVHNLYPYVLWRQAGKTFENGIHQHQFVGRGFANSNYTQPVDASLPQPWPAGYDDSSYEQFARVDALPTGACAASTINVP